MPDPNPQALDFLLNRRSRPAKTLTRPVPDRAALEPILTAGLRSPDHKKLEPWRLIVLESAALMRLSQLVPDRGQALGRPPEEIDKQVAQFADADLAIAVVVSPQPHPSVPESEQALSAGAVCLQILNAALASGWGANWLSGWVSHDPVFVREGLGCDEGEWIAGFIHIGTESSAPPERPRPDPSAKIAWMAD